MVLGLALTILWGRAILLASASDFSSEAAVETATPAVTPTPGPVVASLPATPTRRPTRTPKPTIVATPTSSLPAPEDKDPKRCRETSGQVLDKTYFSDISKTDESYLIYLPPCYDSTDVRYPVIYLLHGSMNDETHWERLGVFQAMDDGLRSGRFSPAIIVLPDGDYNLFMNTSGGRGTYEVQIVDELIPYIDSTYRTDAQRKQRAIGGISRGGVWSFEIGFRHPDLFGIVGGHSAALNVNLSPPEFDPLNMGNVPSLKTQRIWLDAGDADYCQPGSDALHAALDRFGVEHTYQVWSGPHDDSLWAAHLADYMEFYTRTWPRQ